MFTVVAQEKGGKPQRLQFNKSEITIGRVQGNDIVLPRGNISKRHSKIVFKDNKFIVIDLKSTNGTYVNGHRIASPQVIKSSDKVFIGDYILEIESMDSPVQSQNIAPPPVPPSSNLGGGMPPRVPQTPSIPPVPKSPVSPPPPVMPTNNQNNHGHSNPPPMPSATGGSWQSVQVAGGAGSYFYLRIQGGWLISSNAGLAFIADPQHQYTPVPS